MVDPAALPLSLDARAFSSAEALANGVPAQRLRRSDLVGLFHGVRSAVHMLESPDDPSLVDRVTAYGARMPEAHRFSHVTAAALNGLRMPTNFVHDVIHVTSAGGRAPESVGVRGHLSLRPAAVSTSGPRRSAAVDSWIECAPLLPLDDLIVMGDSLVRRKDPLATLEELERAVAAYGTRRGAARLRAALTWIRSGTDSAPETRLRLLVVRAGIPEPEVNEEIRNRLGVVIAHGDLVLRTARVVLEYDGRQHAEDTVQFGIDILRLDDIMEEEWRVIRIDRRLLSQRDVLLGKIRRAMNRHSR